MIESPGFFYRNGNTIQFTQKEKDKCQPLETQKLSQIILNEEDNNYEIVFNNYELDDNDNITTPNSAWFVLRKNDMNPRMNSYRLNEGDIIRVGRITTRIRTIKFKKMYENNKDNISINTELNLKEICNVKKTQIIKNNSLEQIAKKPTLVKIKSKTTTIEKNNSYEKEEENKICRICYMEEESKDNPLVQPCICSGSMRYIHLNCLKHWLNTSTYNLLDSNDDYFLFLYKKAECELCKTKLPDYIRHKGKLYEIIDLRSEIPYNNYMILESLTLDKQNNKYIYVVSLDKNRQINIGRGHEASLVLSDISVSRLHCFLTVDNKGKTILLHDNHSKFGTLVLVQSNNLKLAKNLKLYVQIGKTFFEMLYLQNVCVFNWCCCAGEKYDDDYYYRQNNVKLTQFKKLTVKTEMDFEEQESNNNGEDIQSKEVNITSINNLNTNINEIMVINDEENENNNKISERDNENGSESIKIDDEDNENESKNN